MSLIVRHFDLPADEKPDRPRANGLVKVVGPEVYEAWLKMKRAELGLTQREFGDRLGLNLTQVKNALRRQRKARGVLKPLRRGQYRDHQLE